MNIIDESNFQVVKYKRVIKGDNCSLVRFKDEDEKLIEMIHSLFNEKEIAIFLNPGYLKYRTRLKIRKWIKEKSENPIEVWYVIKWKSNYIGYVCFKWRKHYDKACEISTAIVKEYRGLKLGYESSKILIDYILGLKKFKYIVGYVFKTNKKAENNLKKIGFRKANRLNKIITIEFYGSDGLEEEDRRYNLMVVYGS